MACPGTKADGSACRANVRQGEAWCRWHDPTAEGRRRHREESQRGGRSKAYSAIPATAPLAEALDLDHLDLTTSAGIVELLGGTLAALSRLPFDCRVGNCVAQVATAARAAIEASALAERVAALEAATAWPARH